MPRAGTVPAKRSVSPKSRSTLRCKIPLSRCQGQRRRLPRRLRPLPSKPLVTACDRFSVMEISRDKALECLNRWKDRGTLVGLYFAARGGTAFATMLARITEVGATLVFRNEATLLRYASFNA